VIGMIGHFGSRFSYATVGAKIGAKLAATGRLGQVLNLDDQMLADYEFLKAGRAESFSDPLLALTAPSPVFDTILTAYKNMGLFLSPNTAELSREHARALDQCRIGFAPSHYCAEVSRAHSKTPVEVCRLGVADEYAETRFARRPRNEPFTFLHATTDFYLPGRKGTEELIEAWGIVRGELPAARLIVHAPSGISTHIHYGLSDQEAADGLGYGRFRLTEPPRRGTEEADLARLLLSADAVVLPSRCEGFGMVILAALVLGVPLVTTNVTGQKDFLGDFPGCFVEAPTGGTGPLVGEDGQAPLVDVEGLADAMVRLHKSYDTVFDAAQRVPQETRRKWTWSESMKGWADKLSAWEAQR